MHVWRYMSFAKFVWTIQNKCLWLSRADLLGDPWEISLSGEQLQLVIDRQPITPVGEAPKETAEERAERIINLWRSNTFISCWNSVCKLFIYSVCGVGVMFTDKIVSPTVESTISFIVYVPGYT